jgi:hypothetical protein
VRRFLVFAIMLAAAAVTARAQEWNKSFTVSGRPQIVVEADDGNVIVNAGAASQVAVRVQVIGWRLDDDVKVGASQSGNRIEITVRKRSGFAGLFGSHSIRITLSAPPESDLALHTKDGNVEISDIRGRQQLRTGDGNITLRGVEGAVSCDTGDGNIHAEGRFDEFNARTGDGNIDARVRAGSKMSGGWSISTGDGNVRLELPSSLAANLDAHTGDGHVRSDLPLTVSGSMSERAIRGQLNSGGPTLEVRTGDGDIRLVKTVGSL